MESVFINTQNGLIPSTTLCDKYVNDHDLQHIGHNKTDGHNKTQILVNVVSNSQNPG